MGTTAVAALVSDNVATIGSAGDSRCYLFRDGKITQLTRDDSWVSAAWAEGILSTDEIDRHPLRNVITKAVGAKDSLDLEIVEHGLAPGDVALLCSDGLHAMMGDEDILRVVTPFPAPRGGRPRAGGRRQRGGGQGQRDRGAGALHGVALVGTMPNFGRYEILDKLGEGAMGIVYRARDTALGRVVALKMLSQELGAEEELHQRFMREAEAVGLLSHPNIVTVYDMGESEGQLYMAMELLEGADRASSSEARALPVADRVRILIQICGAWSTRTPRGSCTATQARQHPGHGLGAGEDLDFGLGVVTRAAITRGVILGTPDYMSPEHAMGKPVDRRSDVFPRAPSSTSPDQRSRSRQDPARRPVPDRLRDPDSILTLSRGSRCGCRIRAPHAQKSPDTRYATWGTCGATSWRSTLRCGGRARTRRGGPRPLPTSSVRTVRCAST